MRKPALNDVELLCLIVGQHLLSAVITELARDIPSWGEITRLIDFTPVTLREIADLRADLFVMSTSAIVDDICFHQTLETVDVKRAMFEAASTRVLLADATKFEKRALHAMLPLSDFDVVIVDAGIDHRHVNRLREKGVNVQIARRPAGGC